MTSDPNFVDAVQSGDPRKELAAIRDFLAHELNGARCQTCMMSKLRTGDTAALVLRLQKVLEELRALPNPDAEVDELDELRKRRGGARPPASEGDESALLGGRSAARRTGTRTPRFTGE